MKTSLLPMKSRLPNRKKLNAELDEMTRRLEKARDQVKRVDREQTAAHQKLSEIGKALSGLKVQLTQLAADRAKENGR